MVNYIALRTELNKPAYAGLSNVDAAVAVMTASVTIDRQVPSTEIARFWARRGILANAREAGERGANAAVRILGWRVLDIVSFDVLGELDTGSTTDKTEFITFLDNMVTASIMTAPQRAATLALINKPRTGLEVFGIINEDDVAQARAL